MHDHPAYCANPWGGWYEHVPDSAEDVLLVGTGLTMIDVFLTLHTLGWSGMIYAVSRTGLLPLAHFKGSDYPLFPPDDVDTLGLHSLAALMEEHCARLRAVGMNPALVVDKLRPFTQRIWRNFSVAEKQEFSRDYRTRWNVVRHRIPPTVARQIETAQKENRLRILKGRLGEVQRRRQQDPGDDRFGERTAPRATERGIAGQLHRSPRVARRRAGCPVSETSLNGGWFVPTSWTWESRSTPDFAVVDQHGQPSEYLFAIGPLLRGTLWETTAVPELRAQTHQVAQVLLARDQRHQPDSAQETPENIVEYYI